MTERGQPDPPLAAPLTAEQIAVERVRSIERNARPSIGGFFIGSDDFYSLLAAYPLAVNTANEMARCGHAMRIMRDREAALRDRLARAEERCGELEGALGAIRGGILHMLPYLQARGLTPNRHSNLLPLQVCEHILATPTDGAARAGDAAMVDAGASGAGGDGR